MFHGRAISAVKKALLSCMCLLIGSMKFCIANEIVSTGTGFYVDHNGSVLTNNHVIHGCDAVHVNGVRSKLMALDEANDLALLRTSSARGVAIFRGGRGVRLGEDIVVVGYPLRGVLGAGLNVSTGIVSSLSGLANNYRDMQISAAVNGGNSGGPVLDQNGYVVGVVYSKVNALKSMLTLGDVVQGGNFAIKASVARNFLDANNIRYGISVAGLEKNTVDIVDEAQDYTALIECVREKHPDSTVKKNAVYKKADAKRKKKQSTLSRRNKSYYSSSSPGVGKKLHIEVTKLEQRDDLCVTYLRFSNKTHHVINELKLELFAFDNNDVINAHFLADFQKVGSNKIVVKLVPMKDVSCSSVSDILLSSVVSCSSSSISGNECMKIIQPASNGAVRLFK